MVNKLVRNFITFILSATIFICIQIIIICNSVNTAITRDNFNKCIGTLNKKLLVENNGENFEQIIKEYSNKIIIKMSTSTAPPTQPSIQPSQPITDSTTPESQSKPEESQAPQIPSPFPVLTK